MDPAAILVLLKKVHELYETVNFDENTRNELLRKAVRKQSDVAQFTLYRSKHFYNELKKIVKHFAVGVELFARSHETDGDCKENC